MGYYTMCIVVVKETVHHDIHSLSNVCNWTFYKKVASVSTFLVKAFFGWGVRKEEGIEGWARWRLELDSLGGLGSYVPVFFYGDRNHWRLGGGHINNDREGRTASNKDSR